MRPLDRREGTPPAARLSKASSNSALVMLTGSFGAGSGSKTIPKKAATWRRAM